MFGNLRKRGLEVIGRLAGSVYDITVSDPSKNRCAFPVLSEPITLVAQGGAGQLAAWANPSGIPILVLEVLMDITTDAAGVASIDAGVAATAATSSDTLLDGVDVGTAPIFATVGVNGGTNGRQARRMLASEFVTFTGSAATTGLVGTARVLYVPLPV